MAALILHAGQIATVFVLGPSLAIRKKYRGENLFRNPARCLGAKIFLYTLFESAVMAICLAIGIKFFGMICRGNPSEILILVAAYVACVTAFGLMMGAVAREPHQAITWSLFYVMPISYAANDLRNFLVKGTAAGVEVHIAALLLMSAIFFAAAVGVLKFKGAKVFANDNAQGIFNLLTHERLAVLVILLFAATAYSLLIGNLYRGGIVERIPVAVCDLEDSSLSRELIRAVADADQYNFRETLSNDAEAVKLLERGEVAAVLVIPQDFSEKFYRQESVELAFLQDGSNTLQAG